MINTINTYYGKFFNNTQKTIKAAIITAAAAVAIRILYNVHKRRTRRAIVESLRNKHPNMFIPRPSKVNAAESLHIRICNQLGEKNLCRSIYNRKGKLIVDGKELSKFQFP